MSNVPQIPEKIAGTFMLAGALQAAFTSLNDMDEALTPEIDNMRVEIVEKMRALIGLTIKLADPYIKIT